MSHFESLTCQWTLFCFLSLFNNQVLSWSRDSPPHHPRQSSRAWSEWSQWSACSRTCGGGVRHRTRACGQRMLGYRVENVECKGESIDHELCSRHDCLDSGDFIDQQCSQKNGQTVLGKKVDDWIPYRYRKNPCELECWPRDRTLVYSFGKVVDGTHCPASDIRDPAICVNGRCTVVDCAGRVGLQSHRDQCGVCQGDNSTCVRYHDTFFERPRYKLRGSVRKDIHEYDYISIFSIPAGAMHISVSENSNTNFLVLVDHMGNYLVNGNRRVQPSGRILVHGSEFVYNTTEGGYETLSSVGPTRFILKVMVMGFGDIPMVNYEYWISTITAYAPHHLLQTTKAPTKPPTQALHPFHNSIETSSAPQTKVSPVTKFHTYKSYYHRNEILKSVPSWSIKRHKSLKPSLNKPNVDSRIGTKDHLRHLETFDRNGYRTTVSPTTNNEGDYNMVERYNDFGRPNGTSAFTRYSRVVTNYEDRIRKLKSVATTPGIKLAEKDREIIVPRKTKSKTEKVEESRVKRKRKSEQGICLPCIRNKQQTRSFCKSDFVIRAIVLSSETHHHATRFEFEVVRSYKNRVPMLSREYVWTPDMCPCPKLRIGKEYILMGSAVVGRRESQLVVGRDSFVRQYSHKRAKTMLRLVRDQHSVCKKY